MEKRLETKQNDIVFYTKCVVLVIGLLTSIPYVNSLGRDIYKICLVWYFLCIVYLFLKNRENYCRKEYLFFGLFCCSYALTIVVHHSQHFVNEVALLGYTGMLLFGMTYYDKKRSAEETKEELKKIAWIIVSVTWVFSLISFGMFLFSFSGYFKLMGTSYVYGMRENRLWGLYNPNTGAVLNYISIIVSILLIKYTEKKHKFLKANIVIQGLCFILTQSRGAWICVFGYLGIYLMFIKEWKKDFSGIKKWAYKFCATLIICLAVLLASNVVKEGLSYLPNGIDYLFLSEEARSKKHKKLDRLDKKKKNMNSITTGRSDMWLMGLESYKENPVLGIGYRSIDDMLKEKMTKKSYKNSSGGGLHNTYVTVLTSAGTLGFVTFMAGILVLLIKIIKSFFNKNTPDYVRYIYTFIPVWLLGEMVESRIILGMNFMAIIFWIISGYAMYYTEKGENSDGKHSSSGI